MSQINVDAIKNRAGTGAPTLTYGASIPVGYAVTGAGGVNVTGVITATSFVGPLTGTASTATAAATAYGLTGSPNITVGNIVGAALTLSGNLTVNGTQTTINTTNLEITDPLIGIGSGNTTDAQANGDGILIYGATNKTLTYNDTKKDLRLMLLGQQLIQGL